VTPHETFPPQEVVKAVLFATGDAVPLDHLAAALERGADETRVILNQLADELQRAHAGIQLFEADGRFQLCTNPAYHPFVQKMRPEPSQRNLTQPLLETLSIVAHKQPATKGMIEEIRGVQADHAVNKLLEYGLIAEAGRLDAPGKPILFATSDEFLRYFGIKNVTEFLEAVENGAQITLEETETPA